jgi:uncharacterized protein
MTLADACRAGAPLAGETIVDIHCHMGPWTAFHVPRQGSPSSMVATMDRIGVRCALVSPHLAIGPDFRAGNRQAAAAAAHHPGRLISYVTIAPGDGARITRAEVEYWHGAGAVQGFKIHPALHGRSALDQAYEPVFDYAHSRALPILIHSWPGDAHASPATIRSLADRYTHAQLVIAHSAAGWDMLQQVADACAGRPNVHLDLTGSRLFSGLLEAMVARVGPERILFGTDMPFIDPRPGLGRVLMADIADDAKRLILGLNALRVYRLALP